MGWHVMAIPHGWVEMIGPTGRIVVPEKDVAWHERRGWFRASYIRVQDAPGEATPMDTTRMILPDDENADF